MYRTSTLFLYEMERLKICFIIIISYRYIEQNVNKFTTFNLMVLFICLETFA